MNCLVTGAQGFLGNQVVLALRSAGVMVAATGRRPTANVDVCDLTSASDVRRLVGVIKPDYIIHCAAHVPKKLAEYQDECNAKESLYMIEMILQASDCPLVFISSMTVYGTERDRPVVEEDAGDPASAYGCGKWQAEQRLKVEARPTLAIRIPGLFGPSRQSGLVYNLMHGIKYNYGYTLPQTATLWAAMHVNDAATSIAKLALSGIQGFETINLAYRGNYSIESLVSTVGSIYARHIDYNVMQPSFEFDLTRADARGAVPNGSFRDALVKFRDEI